MRLKKNKKNNNNNNDNNNNNINNNNDNSGGGDLFPPGSPGPDNRNRNDLSFLPEAPTIDNNFNPLPEVYDLQQRLNIQNPDVDSLLQQRLNNLRGPDLISSSNLPPPPLPPSHPIFANNTSNFQIPAQLSSFNRRFGSIQGPGSNIFGSEAATLTRERVKEKTDSQVAMDDTLYELPDNSELELGDPLGNTAEDLFQVDNITKEEEEDVILEKIEEEYGFEDLKDSMDEGKVPGSI